MQNQHLMELVEKIPKDPSKIIPSKHLTPLYDAIVADTLTPEDTMEDEMGGEEEIGGDTAGAPPAAGGGDITPEQKTKIAELLGVDEGELPDDLLAQIGALSETGEAVDAATLIAMLESDPEIASNLAAVLGIGGSESVPMG